MKSHLCFIPAAHISYLKMGVLVNRWPKNWEAHKYSYYFVESVTLKVILLGIWTLGTTLGYKVGTPT